MNKIKLCGLFQKRFEGDDALLTLAQREFSKINLGAEYHAMTLKDLRHDMAYHPKSDMPTIVHLGRSLDPLKEDDFSLIMSFVREFGHCVHGFVLHYKPTLHKNFDASIKCLARLNCAIESTQLNTKIFIEYTARPLTPKSFCHIFDSIRDLPHISACLDIGHIAMQHITEKMKELHPKINWFDFLASTKNQDTDKIFDDLLLTFDSALETVCDIIRHLANIPNKAVHFHLHDGHPLQCSEPYGLSDHSSCLSEQLLPVSYKGEWVQPTIFGKSGLICIIKTALNTIGKNNATFTLEIHPQGDTKNIDDHLEIFHSWNDKSNAELTNGWLNVIAKNAAEIRNIES